MNCIYSNGDGVCLLLSDEEVTQYCVEGPCEQLFTDLAEKLEECE